jgi:uncharacterized damage-inducible protein DinB
VNRYINDIIRNLQRVLNDEPWYGRAVMATLCQAGNGNVYLKPGGKLRSRMELLYHMITWTDFTLAEISGKEKSEIEAIEALDWRTIDPHEHQWAGAVAEFKQKNETLIRLLEEKTDAFLDQPVPFREYTVKFLLEGLIQHHIYHAGQLAYINNLGE